MNFFVLEELYLMDSIDMCLNISLKACLSL